jgi:predicted ester cyclase
MNTTPENLWPRYARIWSCDAATRAAEFPHCLSDEVRYTDPNTAVVGSAAFDAYMAGFQNAMPGCSFEIDEVVHHHDRSLAHWHLRGVDGSVLQKGISTARHADDGRLAEIVGFFQPGAA